MHYYKKVGDNAPLIITGICGERQFSHTEDKLKKKKAKFKVSLHCTNLKWLRTQLSTWLCFVVPNKKINCLKCYCLIIAVFRLYLVWVNEQSK